jgi:OPA family glycerol-3-phosphate transporter-like MFS transporter
MFFSQSIPVMCVVWGVNGFAHALLWPPIVRMMSHYLSDAEYGYAAVRVSWGSSVATIVLYLVCPLLLYVTSWRNIMLGCAIFGVAVTVFWTLINARLLGEGHTASDGSPSPTPRAGIPVPKYVYLPIVLIMIGIVLQGMLRDGVTNWMPSYLLETFALPEENAIIATVILAVFSMISFYVFDLLHRKLLRNEVTCAAAIFVLAVVAALVLYPINASLSAPLPSMLLMAIIVAAMHGINLMLITVVPKRFAKSGRVSTFSGLLNSFTYIGAAIATYGIAGITEKYSWSVIMSLFLGVSLLGIIFTLIALPKWKRFIK